MEKVKKIPQRKCIGCAERRDKGDLMRIVRTPDGEIRFDTTGRAAGRGAYLCPDLECLKRARKSRALERALEISIPAEVYDAMEAELEGRDGQE